MGTLSANVISDTYKNLIFTKETNNKLYYTNGSDVDTEITTLASPMTLSGLITASAGIKLGNNIIYNSDAEACLTLDADQGVSLTAAKVLYVDSIAEKTSANGVSIDSVLLKDGNVKLGASNIIQDSNGGNAIVLDTSSNVSVLGDLTVKGDDIVIGDGDDAADKTINFRHDTCEVWMGIDDSQESNAGAFVIHTGTGFQATKLDNDFVLDSSGNLHLGNGELRTTKIAYTDGADALTVNSGGSLTSAGLLTLGGNLVIPNAGNIGSTSDTDAIAISSAGAVTFSQNIVQSGSGVNTFAGKATFNGGVTSPVKKMGDANLTLTDADSGKYVIIEHATTASRDLILPAVADGLNFKIKVSVDLAQILEIRAAASGNLIEGALNWLDTADGDTSEVKSVISDGKEGISLKSDTKAGTWIDLVCDGTTWFLSGQVHAATAPTIDIDV
tara:strand:- start:36 stop:1367 length:1332 start_codon:yes stop_codon:yes gene_type:complete